MNRYHFGIPDEEFIRGKVPITKEEIRTITLSKLRIDTNSVIVDIGAGTGSISVECALLAREGKVYAIEVAEEGIDLINANKKKFSVENLEVIQAKAPLGLEMIQSADRIIIGGSKGNLPQIMEWADKHLSEDGIIAANFIVLENLMTFTELLKNMNYDWQLINVTVARSRSIGGSTMMEGLNPIYIVSARRASRKS
ncbi:MAG: precorrin-6Y C5,15-methyltransferase (decarboxylating) subunit CbiT [Eubacteriaceae bacterium]|nr:precorrin-6Y C5,15-methyltransferase (decarboxylating) subunit CbiT [Eubacteriaceae bacterium]